MDKVPQMGSLIFRTSQLQRIARKGGLTLAHAFGIMVPESASKMATSSITESFHCDDPKAANAIVRLLFSKKKSDSWHAPKATGVVVGADFRNNAQKYSFGKRLRHKYCGASRV